MDQQVSPAVVIIVLILIVAILVGLYFLVVERSPQSDQGDPGMEVAPMEAGEAAMDPGGADDADAEGGGDAAEGADQPDTGAEQTDADVDDEVGSTEAADSQADDSSGE